MAGIDTDLYGDLYGADDNDFASATDTVQDLSKLDTQDHEHEEPPTPSKVVESAPRPQVHQIPSTDHSQPSAIMTKIESPPPATQQIPTYQQQIPDYGEIPVQRNDGPDDYQGMNRPVRPSEMKEEGKMFIGGLNWDTTDEGLRNYFSQFGKVEACTIMRDAGGRSRCFAFLTFEDPASVNAVMVREHFLDGKIIDPKRAIPRQEHQRATKLFIGGLAGSVTSESMREYFSQFGRVVDSTVMLDRETGRSKGFGFVSLENVDVDPILGFGKLEIDGKLIDVKLAQPRSARDNPPNPREGSAQGFGGSASGGAGSVAGAGFNSQVNYGSGSPMQGQPAASSTPFDANALASLWTRMFQQMGGGGMNPMMGGGGMNPMMASMAGAGGMGMGMPGAMGGMGGMGRGGPMAGMGAMGMGGATMGTMGRGGLGMGNAAMMGGMNANIPRGPRGAAGGGAAGVGPQRTGQRGQHGYHPYSR